MNIHISNQVLNTVNFGSFWLFHIEACGTVITKHVRELVKECIKEAKTTNDEITDESVVESERIEKHNLQV